MKVWLLNNDDDDDDDDEDADDDDAALTCDWFGCCSACENKGVASSLVILIRVILK